MTVIQEHHREDGGRTRQGQNSRLAGDHDLISEHTPVSREYHLPDGILMRYGSEPDTAFIKDGKLRATIEIKGGTDPAGALERLGAVTKSFAETPPGCMNFLIAGVITPEMRSRLDEMGHVKMYLLKDLSLNGDRWEDFTNELFHYALRAT